MTGGGFEASLKRSTLSLKPVEVSCSTLLKKGGSASASSKSLALDEIFPLQGDDSFECVGDASFGFACADFADILNGSVLTLIVGDSGCRAVLELAAESSLTDDGFTTNVSIVCPSFCSHGATFCLTLSVSTRSGEGCLIQEAVGADLRLSSSNFFVTGLSIALGLRSSSSFSPFIAQVGKEPTDFRL